MKKKAEKLGPISEEAILTVLKVINRGYKVSQDTVKYWHKYANRRTLETAQITKDGHHANNNLRRSRKNRGGGSYSVQQWVETLAHYGGECLECGTTRDIVADHVKPVSRGGSSYPWNMQPLCRDCNGRKHARLGGDRRPDRGAWAWKKWSGFTDKVNCAISSSAHPSAYSQSYHLRMIAPFLPQYLGTMYG